MINIILFNGKEKLLAGKDPVLCLKSSKDKQAIFVNDKPYFLMAYLSQFPKQFRFKNMRESGIRFFRRYVHLEPKKPT